MRITIVQIFFISVFTLSAYAHTGNAQDILDKRISLNIENVAVKKVLSIIEKSTGASFVYSPGIIKSGRKISLNADQKKLSDVLNEVLNPANIDYSVENEKVIVLFLLVNKDIVSNTVDRTISGKVTNADGEPLEGVSIIVKGTSKGTTTDKDGSFSIVVSDTDEYIIFSVVGYLNKEEKITGSVLAVQMTAVNKNMDEVVVVGYGTQKKATNTGAQASMAGKLLVQSPAANISNSMVGRMPGLFASQASGEPGNDRSILRIRGVGTFNGNQEPLVLVDGIQVDNYNNIDPNEIENITILKDASSTAVYGIRGANGVLIITTKRGKTGPAKVSYTYNHAINSFTAIRSQMNSYDYAMSFNRALEGDAYTKNAIYQPKFTPDEIEKYRTGVDPIFYPNTDWYDLMLKKSSSQQQHNLSINGGTERVRYAISTGYFNQEGLFNNTELAAGYDAQVRFKRFNFRSNLNFDVSKRFKVAVDISLQIENRSGNALNSQTVIDNIDRANPTGGPGIVDGRLVELPGNSNPLLSLYQEGYQRENRNYLNGSVRLDHDLDFITKGLATHGTVAYQNYNSQRFNNRKPTSSVVYYRPLRLDDGSIVYLPQNQDAQYSFAEVIDKNRRTTAEFGFDYKRTFGDHNITGLLLYNQQKSVDPDFTFLVPAGYQSYVGRTTYDYKNRYLAEINVAYNGTENFAPGNRFGLFPAYSLGWIVSQESFFPLTDVISFLKIRGSYGEVGNDQIGNEFLTSENRFLFRPTAWTFTGGYRFGEVATAYNLVGGLREGRASNPELTWERAKKTNIGVEMAFWKKNISVSVDVFEESRDNILTTRQTVPSIVGVPIPPENLGKMKNRGYEVDFTLNHNIGKFNYQVKANYSFARNEVVYKDEVTPVFPYQAETGKRFGQLFGLIDQGMFNTWDEVNDPKRPVYEWQNNRLQPGDLKFEDVNGDGLINSFDRVAIGYSQIPEKTFGVSFVGQYKGFSLSVLFQGAANVSIQYTRRFTQGFFDNPPAGAVDYLLESWTKERYEAGLPIKFPRFSLGVNGSAPNNYESSTFFLADASYLRLKNVELGYTFNGGVLKKVGLNSTRIFVNANNLYTWSKMFPGVDPESPPTVTNLLPYPLVRTINMGININF